MDVSRVALEATESANWVDQDLQWDWHHQVTHSTTPRRQF